MPSTTWKIRRFNLRLIVGASSVFGAGTTVVNMLSLLYPPATPMAPASFRVFDALMGAGYLLAAWTIGLERRWALGWVWALAALHACAATLLAVGWLIPGWIAQQGIPGAVVAVALGREGFWVLIGLYLWKGGEALSVSAPDKREQQD